MLLVSGFDHINDLQRMNGRGWPHKFALTITLDWMTGALAGNEATKITSTSRQHVSACLLWGQPLKSWEKVNCVQPQSAHPSTDCNQNLHRSLCKSDQQLCQIWWKSHHWGLRYTCVKFNTCVRFYSIFPLPFPSRPFPFLFYTCHRLQPKRLNRFSWLMAQNAWIGARKCLSYVWTMSDQFLGVVSSKNYPEIALDAEIPANKVE